MTGRSSLDAGKRWERDAAKHAMTVLGTAGYDDITVGRRASLGLHDDEGDLFGLPFFTVQCKNTGRIDLTVVDEAEVQAANAGSQYGVLLQKRRNSSTGRAYVVMTYDTLLRVIVALLDQKGD